MRRIRWAACALAVFSVLALKPPEASADGDLLRDRARYERVPLWQPPATGVGAVPRIDLSEKMPPPGHQAPHNSCVGWSLAYTIKSHQEALDQGWRPDDASRVFSPSFVWCPLNEGHDRGISLAAAMERLQTHGCAPWNLMPYPPPTVSEAPSEAATRAAQGFRISAFHRLGGTADIRRALQEGNPVAVAVLTDPVFTTGKFDLWTRAKRVEGDQSARASGLRRRDAWHAMVVVGYDDARGAFRMMNSWGPDWADGGYCWASQELFAQVPNAADDAPDLFISEAMIAIDEKTGSVAPPRDPSGPTDVQLAAGGTMDYVGLKDGLPTWICRLYVEGAPAALDAVESVTWRLPDGHGGTLTQPANDRAGQFGLQFQNVGPRTVEAVGEVALRGGARREVRQTFLFLAPDRTDLRLAQFDRYLGWQHERHYWEWGLRLEGSPADLADVDRVVYHLDETFPIPHPVVTQSAATGFEMRTSGYGQLAVGATIHFRDGRSEERSHMLQFRDPVRTEVRIQSVHRQMAVVSGNPLFAFTVHLDAPLITLRKMTRVVWWFSPRFEPPNREAAYAPELGFPMSSTLYTVTDVAADITFDDGQTMRVVGKVQ